jgi:SAM-dependent methyltransferase
MTSSRAAAFVELLGCPRCSKPLVDGPPLRCEHCRVDYPDIGGIPWLFAEPSAALAEWRQRIHRLLKQWEADAARTQSALRTAGLHPLTRRRLEHLGTAQSAHLGELARLLTPLQLDSLTTALETHLALRTRLPPAQGLTTYYANLHRDWCWGGEENAASFELVASALGNAARETTLVLGSGAGRLAYDVHMQRAPVTTVALDINPLLALAAQQIVQGATLDLHEFPLAPRHLDDVAVARVLTAPTPVAKGFYPVLADGLRAPFVAEAFDAVVTPWFIDIVAEDLPVLAQRINRLLKPGGRWVIFGSLAFVRPDLAACLSLEETAAVIAANGFTEPQVVEATIPYMCSPASRHGRREQVVTITADKRKRVAAPERYTALPEWLVQSNRPVPLLDSFRLQATTTRIYAFIMAMIDGRRSVGDMAALMEQQRLMSRAEAEAAIRSFLIKMYDESQAPGSL